MPQPLTKVSPKAKVDSWGVGSLLKRPVLALQFAQVLSSWSDVEGAQLRVFVKLLGGNQSLASKIYMALDTARAKSQALEQLVDSIDDEKRKSLARAIIGLTRSFQKERDRLAHCSLAISREIPDGLLVLDHRDGMAKGNWGNVLVYREIDFTKTIEANLRLFDYLLDLPSVLNRRRTKKGDRLLDELYRKPEIRERLDRQALPTRSAPAKSS